MHATIERAAKHHAVYNTRERETILGIARQQPSPYIADKLKINEIMDLIVLAQRIIKNS